MRFMESQVPSARDWAPAHPFPVPKGEGPGHPAHEVHGIPGPKCEELGHPAHPFPVPKARTGLHHEVHGIQVPSARDLGTRLIPSRSQRRGTGAPAQFGRSDKMPRKVWHNVPMSQAAAFPCLLRLPSPSIGGDRARASALDAGGVFGLLRHCRQGFAGGGDPGTDAEHRRQKKSLQRDRSRPVGACGAMYETGVKVYGDARTAGSGCVAPSAALTAGRAGHAGYTDWRTRCGGGPDPA